jgi:hypothetical protein
MLSKAAYCYAKEYQHRYTEKKCQREPSSTQYRAGKQKNTIKKPPGEMSLLL